MIDLRDCMKMRCADSLLKRHRDHVKEENKKDKKIKHVCTEECRTREVGYPVKDLTTKHLIAEHREIKRIPNTIVSGKAIVKDIPETFRLGAGHVKFFYDKLGYLLNRYRELYAECLRRGFNVQDYSGAWDEVPSHLMGDYTPTESDKALIQELIRSKLRARNI